MKFALCVRGLAPGLLAVAIAQRCAQDGSDYSYSESVSGSTRTIAANICPNHPYYNLNPNYAYSSATTYRMPSQPTYVGSATDSSTSSAHIDLSAKGGAMGLFFSGAQMYSPYGGTRYGTTTGWTTSATYAEGNSFDQCGCHASSSTKATYHCHVPPACLLRQLGQTDAAHSPQIGWAFDGFPIYGPRGPGGVMMQTCTVTGGTYGTDACTDDCGGYYKDDGSIDMFVYRYYMLGEYGDGSSCTAPACPSPTADYFPNSMMCFRGCCPSGVSCQNGITACPSSGTSDGYISGYAAEAPTVNGLSVAAGLPVNAPDDTGICSCSDLTCASTCAQSSWSEDNQRCGQVANTCPATPQPTPAPAGATPQPTPQPTPGLYQPTPAPAETTPAPATDCLTAFNAGKERCEDDPCTATCTSLMANLMTMCTNGESYQDEDGAMVYIMGELQGIQAMCADPCMAKMMGVGVCTDEQGRPVCSDECNAKYLALEGCTDPPPGSEAGTPSLEEMGRMMAGMCEPCMQSFMEFSQGGCFEDGRDCTLCMQGVTNMYDRCEDHHTFVNPEDQSIVKILDMAALGRMAVASACGDGGGGAPAPAPCVTVARDVVARIEAKGYHVVACETRRQRRLQEGLDPGPPCPSSKKRLADLLTRRGRGLRPSPTKFNATLSAKPKAKLGSKTFQPRSLKDPLRAFKKLTAQKFKFTEAISGKVPTLKKPETFI